MEPRPNLQSVPIREWVVGSRVCLCPDLDLLLKTEFGSQWELSREILDEPGGGNQRLAV